MFRFNGDALKSVVLSHRRLERHAELGIRDAIGPEF